MGSAVYFSRRVFTENLKAEAHENKGITKKHEAVKSILLYLFSVGCEDPNGMRP